MALVHITRHSSTGHRSIDLETTPQLQAPLLLLLLLLLRLEYQALQSFDQQYIPISKRFESQPLASNTYTAANTSHRC